MNDWESTRVQWTEDIRRMRPHLSVSLSDVSENVFVTNADETQHCVIVHNEPDQPLYRLWFFDECSGEGWVCKHAHDFVGVLAALDKRMGV